MTTRELQSIAAKLAEQVQQRRNKAADVVPPGWFTSHELAKITKLDRRRMTERLSVAGAERKKFLVFYDGKLRPTFHYKLK